MMLKLNRRLLQKYKHKHQEIQHKQNLENLKSKEPELYNIQAPTLMQ